MEAGNREQSKQDDGDPGLQEGCWRMLPWGMQGDWAKRNCPHTAGQGPAPAPRLACHGTTRVHSISSPDALCLGGCLACKPTLHQQRALTPRASRRAKCFSGKNSKQIALYHSVPQPPHPNPHEETFTLLDNGASKPLPFTHPLTDLLIHYFGNSQVFIENL